MRTQIKIPIFIVLFALIALSCSQEDLSAPEDFKVAKQQVQFDFNTTEEPLDEDQNQFNATISSVDPLVIESDELEVFIYFDHETDTYVEGVAKIGTSQNSESDNGEPCEYKEVRGYFYDPNSLCFYSGVLVTYEDCTVRFHVDTKPYSFLHIICVTDFLIGL